MAQRKPRAPTIPADEDEYIHGKSNCIALVDIVNLRNVVSENTRGVEQNKIDINSFNEKLNDLRIDYARTDQWIIGLRESMPALIEKINRANGAIPHINDTLTEMKSQNTESQTKIDKLILAFGTTMPGVQTDVADITKKVDKWGETIDYTKARINKIYSYLAGACFILAVVWEMGCHLGWFTRLTSGG